MDIRAGGHIALTQNDRTVMKDTQIQMMTKPEEIKQFDPTNDFAVFGVTDTTKGGIVHMKDKMKESDLIVREESGVQT